ncbi:WSC domain-containing protein [Terfezia claveryi]|nr:WSC domain-containing protein [Terfezia claveryi]
MRVLASLALFAISFLPLKILALAPTDQIQDGDISQSGYYSDKGISLQLIEDPTFGNLWTTNTNEGTKEQFYAKPLVYTPDSTGRQVVIAASQMNWVYIMDAFNGTIIRSRQLSRPFLVADLNGCNDIGGFVGITGTPIIDPATDTIYLFSKSYKDPNPGGPTGYLNGMYRVWALSAIDLSSRPGFPVILDGHPADNDLGKYFHGGTHLQRPSAHLQNGVLYGVLPDTGDDQFNYTGWVAGIDKTTGEVKTMFNGTWSGGGGGAGIWMGGFGFTSDNANRLFYVTGNGYGHENQQFPVSGKTPPGTLEECIVNMAVDPATGKVKPQDFFQPYEYLSLDAADKDFGSGGLALLDPGTFNGANGQRLGATVGKNAKMYIANLDNLGIVQTINTPGGSAVFGGVGSYPGEGGYLYMAPVGYSTLVYKFGRDGSGNAVFTQVAMTDEASAGRVGVGVPTITSLDGIAGTAILWLTDPDNGLRAWKAVPEAGKMIRIPLPPTSFVNKFQRPVFGNKKIYVSTSNGQILCLGSPVALPLTCSSPVDFGNVVLGAVATRQVNCTCNIPVTSIAGVVVQNIKYFAASNATLPTGPCTKGSAFSFPVYMNLTSTVIAAMPNTSVPGVIPGPVSGAINILTNNGVTGYSSSQPISLAGILVSNAAILQLTPPEVSFGGVVVGSPDAIAGVTSSMFINNLGKQSLELTGYAYTLDESDTDWVDVQPPANDSSVWILNDGFTAKLPPLGTVLEGGASIAVELRFTASVIGDFSLLLGIKSNVSGNTYQVIVLAGVAATAPVGLLETQVGNGTYTNATTVEFGNVPGGTTLKAIIRITNNGGSALTVTKSKPPEGAELGAVNPAADLHEGIHILPNTSALGLVAFEPLVSNILNQLPRDISGQWTLNTDGLNFGGPYEVKFHGTAVTPQVGPTFANGSSIYRYLGCYKDSTANRIEPNNFVNQASNENGLCQTTCHQKNWVFAGTEYKWECWCGDFIPDNNLLVDNSFCDLQCSGDTTQVCGGTNGYASFYYDAARYDPVTKAFDGVVGKGTPHIVQSTKNFTYQGCYSEATGGRALTGKSISSVNVNVQFCADYCEAYTYFGVEYGRECYCGNTLAATSTKKPDTDCNMFCAADQFAYCGAGGRLGLYKQGANSTATITSTTASGSLLASTTILPVTSTATTTTAPPTGPTSAANYTYIACWSDSDLGNRTLQGKTIQDQGDSPDFCHTFCAGFAYFGLEYGYECWCGDVVRDVSEQRPETECNMPCAGDAAYNCGAGFRLNLYHNVPSAPVNTTSTPAISETTAPENTATTADIVTTTAATTTAEIITTIAPVNTTTTAVIVTTTALVNTTTTAVIVTTTALVNTTTTAVIVTTTDPVIVVNTTTSTSTSVTSTSTTAAPTATSISTYLGCWTDAVANRTLRAKTFRNANVTVEYCETSCLPYGAYYGVEYSNECFCGKLIEGPTTKRNETECNMKCAGDASKICGGSNRLNLYIYNRNLTTTTTTTTSIGPGTDLTTAVTATTLATEVITVTATTTTTTTPVTPTPTIPVGDANFDYYGCYTDKVGARVLAAWGIPASGTMTIQKCLTGCSQFEFAGLEYGKECWCGNTLSSTSLLRPDSECKMACAGDATQKCGDANRLSLFRKKTAVPTTTSI